MGFFRRKKKKNAVVIKTAIQNLNEEIKKYTTTVNNLERLKPRLSKLIIHYKKQLSSYNHVYDGGVRLSFVKHFKDYPDGFFATADTLGLNIEPVCASTYNYDEKTFLVRAKSK